MLRLGTLLAFVVCFALAACSKSETSANPGSAGSPNLMWDQGSWNQQNWQ